MASDDPYLRIRGLSKRFGDVAALTDVSLDVAESEFVCFLGPSGCGKTTLLRAIAGLDVQSQGGIAQGGCDISTLPPSQRDFGIVFQSYALFPNLDVRRNVGYGLHSRRVARADVNARVSELLALVGLSDQGHKYPAQLSGGEQQRVALARALAISPGLLLLDEPLSALDAKVRARLRREIKDLQRKLGVTTIMVTHDQEEALTMADRIVLMREGAIEQVGTPDELYNAPASRFAADFIGVMNFLPGRVGEDRRVHVGALGFETRNGLAEIAPGTAVTLCVRPEELEIATADALTANRFAARITAVEFLGGVYRVDLALAGGDGAVLRVDLSPAVARAIGAEPGRSLEVRVPRERIRIFVDD